MTLRLHLDFRHGLVEPQLDAADDGTLRLTLTHGQTQVVVDGSRPSLEALWLLLTERLAALTRP